MTREQVIVHMQGQHDRFVMELECARAECNAKTRRHFAKHDAEQVMAFRVAIEAVRVMPDAMMHLLITGLERENGK